MTEGTSRSSWNGQGTSSGGRAPDHLRWRSNGKIERWHKSLKGECIRLGTPLSLEDARRLVQGYVEHYNNVRLNSAIGYITPKDVVAGRCPEIHAERDRKLEEARKQRQIRQRTPLKNDEQTFQSRGRSG